MALNEDVLEMVRRQLERDPPPPTAALYGRATRIDRDIYELTLRQFHAKYPLRVKRERAREEGSPGGGGGDGPRDGCAPADGRARERAAPVAGRRADRDGVAPEAPGPENGGTSSRQGGALESRTGEAPAAEATTAASTRPDPDIRGRVREVFYRVARDVASAEGAAGLAEMVRRLPERVEEVECVIATAGRGS